MNQRYNCVFSNCYCDSYIKNKNNLCINCNHANVWHSLQSKPPCDDYLSFVSPRKFARKPFYEKRHIITILEPQVPPLPESSDEELPYCTNVQMLPV